MNIAANPVIEADQTIYLKDYQKPSFIVDSIDLNIQVYSDHSLVSSKLEMQRQNCWRSGSAWPRSRAAID